MSTPPNALTDQLPTALDPQRAALLQLFPQQGGGAAPPPAPTSSPSPDIMAEMVEASRQGRQIFGAESAKTGALGGQAESLIQQQAQTPIPKMGWLDTQGKPQQGGFLHNLGRTLMTLGAATVPGRAIQAAQYGPGIERYEAETGARAKQIEELRGQEEQHEKLATAGAGMVSKPITAAGSALRGEAAVSKADTYAQQVQNQLTVALKGLDLKALATGSQVALNAARQKLLTIKAQLEPQRVAIAQEGVELGAATKQAISNAMIQLGVQKDHPLASLVDSVFGTDFTPAAPQTDTGKTGAGATVPPKKPGTTPARPKGVPADAKYDPKTQTWYR